MVAASLSFDQHGSDHIPAPVLPWADPYIAMLVERHYLQTSMSQTAWQARLQQESDRRED